MRLIRSGFASLFRALFRINFLRHSYYGFYKKLFAPTDLFKGVKKRIRYRKNIQLELEIEDWIPQNLYFLNEYEEKEIRFLERFLKPGDVFVDIGANIGLFSLVASGIVGTEGKVYAFEPFEKNYETLVYHINSNHLKNITAEKIAVSDKEDWIELYLDEREKNLGMASSFTSSFSVKERVFSTSLDSYFKNSEDPKIRLIKIDIEGAEYLALKGMRQLIKKNQPALLVEINPEILKNTPFKQSDVESLLLDAGYEKFFVGNEGEIVNEKQKGDKSDNYLFLVERLL